MLEAINKKQYVLEFSPQSSLYEYACLAGLSVAVPRLWPGENVPQLAHDAGPL